MNLEGVESEYVSKCTRKVWKANVSPKDRIAMTLNASIEGDCLKVSLDVQNRVMNRTKMRKCKHVCWSPEEYVDRFSEEYERQNRPLEA